MQTLLTDIELDIHELKCLMQAISGSSDPTLRIVARRNILQMRGRLDALLEQLDQAVPDAPMAVPSSEDAPPASPAAVSPSASVPRPEPAPVIEPVPLPEPASEPVPPSAPFSSPASPILAERIRPATDLRRAISLNDSFRFTRELFKGDAARMSEVVRKIGAAPTLEKALDIFFSTVHPDEENEATTDFIELLKKYFN